MFKHDSTSPTARQMLDTLRAMRDEARVQAHLFSLDAKQRWTELENKLMGLQSKLELGGDRAAAGASSVFHEVTSAVNDLVRQLEGTRELTSAVRTVMQEAPATVASGDTLNRAAQIMWERNCGAVPVTSDDGTVAGIITDRDICMAAYTRGLSLSNLSVAGAMSREVHSAGPNDSLAEALRIMAEKQVHRLPITEAGKLVGILSLADVARRVRAQEGNRLAGCVALAHTVASISENAAPPSASASAPH
jgi:CBS domain-containing protein